MEGENELSASPRADEILNLDEEEQGDWENICMVTESAIDQKQNKTLVRDKEQPVKDEEKQNGNS